MMIHIRHIRAADLCTGGAREWFKANGLSWQEFLEKGVPVEVIEALNDGLGNRVAKIAREEAEDGRQQ